MINFSVRIIEIYTLKSTYKTLDEKRSHHYCPMSYFEYASHNLKAQERINTITLDNTNAK